eukprot:gnl/Spiro4/5647_TR2881_c0_g1_i1.p1 gnl/Spiro4/5647_TR2881_c0_g1~~gnl/Spiro4/5647_TR2881_c0_g1_i1.p1  ORF type:complete len:243 (-),score=53.25 gnl/Spiro4/5647_TR2881_c0_g1_i1:234-962(-)
MFPGDTKPFPLFLSDLKHSARRSHRLLWQVASGRKFPLPFPFDSESDSGSDESESHSGSDEASESGRCTGTESESGSTCRSGEGARRADGRERTQTKRASRSHRNCDDLNDPDPDTDTDHAPTDLSTFNISVDLVPDDFDESELNPVWAQRFAATERRRRARNAPPAEPSPEEKVQSEADARADEVRVWEALYGANNDPSLVQRVTELEHSLGSLFSEVCARKAPVLWPTLPLSCASISSQN